MPKTLQLKFDPNQEHQREAIQAVLDALDGLGTPGQRGTDGALSLDVVPNLAPGEELNEAWLLDNIVAVQERFNAAHEAHAAIAVNRALEADEGIVLDGAGNDSWRYPSFTIEMETGTGKTYVYLRTIHELAQRFGLRKYVIVVPSLAIYEGVLKSLAITKGHLASLYGNQTVEVYPYEGSRLSMLRHYATTTSISILVMTLAAFNSKSNVLYRPSEALPGERLPYQYIQETRPILILDEPQNMASERSLEALRALHPLLALRYSATHRETPNLLYRLTPFDSYRLGLVKRIQVEAVTERGDANLPFMALEGIQQTGRRWSAQVRTRINERGAAREGTLTLYQGDDLGKRTLRDEHAGYVVSEIHAGEGLVTFGNGSQLRLHEGLGPSRPEVFKVQLERTIAEHMRRQEELLERGIKVLSLIFIDRVANYVDQDGLIRRLFDEAFERLKAESPLFRDSHAARVREAYFAQRKKKGSDEGEAIDTTGRNAAEREAERSAFALIMRNKEKLLSLEEPVCFIFAHSALKEGWDNPNVFQICTLNQTVSEMKKRQEIGRGLRLAVNQEGERVLDEDVNVLTVVANESYDSYVSQLQTEYTEAGQSAPPPPTQARRATATRNEALFADGCFRGFWERVAQRAQYELRVDTEALVSLCLERLNNERKDFYELKPIIAVERGAFVMAEYRITLLGVRGPLAHLKVEISDTAGDKVGHEHRDFAVRDRLEKHCGDEHLRDYQITAVSAEGDDPRVEFASGVTLRPDKPLAFTVSRGRVLRARTNLAPEQAHAVPNLIERAARETGLTRATLTRIFAGLNPRRAEMILTNPEGFAGWFIGIVRGALADHLVDHMTFVVHGGGDPADLERLFPAQRAFVQKELVPTNAAGLYDQVQIDSDVELRFVQERLKPDGKVVCYFKFPPAFKVPLPRVVGNYNPDWGILRQAEDGRILLQLVRETKGSVDPRLLQFAHEKRKIAAAQAYFGELGVDFRVVTDQVVDWWEAETLQEEWPQ